jgi:flagellar motor switch protein FliG
MGKLAKLPRDAHRFEELKTTTRLTCHDLLKLPVPETKKKKKGKRPPASVSGCYLSEAEAAKTKTSYLRLAEVLLDNHRLQTSTNSVVEAEDVAVFMMFLKFFTERQRNEVMLRIATMEGIQPAALKDLNEVLFKVLAGSEGARKTSLGGVKTAAEMINQLGTALEGTVIESIRIHDPELAQKIMDKMFVFDDLLKLDDKAIQAVLKEIASDTFIVALKGAPPELKDKIMANMSTRAAEAFREDLESRGPMRLSEVEAQQKEILKVVRRLADEGTIVIVTGGDEAMV